MPVKNELMKEVNKNITERQKVGRREKRRETVKKRVKKKRLKNIDIYFLVFSQC